MSWLKTVLPTRALHWVGAGVVFAVAGIFGAILFVWSGVYNIAAIDPHVPAVNWLITVAKVNSIDRHSNDVPARPPLDQPAQVQRGAVQFDMECGACHGTPAAPQTGLLRNMRPRPPKLSEVVDRHTSKELFWIVKHGIKYTGMPGWPAPERDDEVWSMVTFLEQIQDMKPDAYRQLANTDPERPPAGAPDGLQTCARCHGYDGHGKGKGAYPILSIQEKEYLSRSLQAYADDHRHSGTMGPIASGLSDKQMDRLATWYANQPSDDLPDDTSPASELVMRGKKIAEKGLPDQDVEACISCHVRAKGRRFDIVFPNLEGQYANYIADQLLAWKTRGRGRTREGQLMKPMSDISHNLSNQEIRAVAAYFATAK
ncbi:c-type cytochrome [Rhodovibrio salinarum]|uniref:Cytochrome c domain-containing protein n=1 Tax=Rhodovibrio salinarum TaxID=1087 RepID=A0A934QMJ8_9PROT|nr:c-type cytochrome [Rhodovibrio salinarum]MBK1699288.1 hypothetical protein [Rhodovibrio salinarum]